ncbi:hypothetical protein M2D63_001520 [Pseudomonas sp. BJa5]|uniref:hypothetical protein n=1 Tax=Pseudomonas sp. BJa5 TaxID=2936270 RepID=UPI00255A0E92|nr:hypothetical protein [Pseudomonas sp. BGr12]MDL2419796.1 hypothetical protein [Pseudomonas sp. BGr12]
MSEKRTLLDEWIFKAKNHPIVAATCFAAVIFAGAASIVGNISDIVDSDLYRRLFDAKDTPPAKKEFKEKFSIEESETFIGDHYVSVKNGGIYLDPDTDEWQILNIEISIPEGVQAYAGLKKGTIFKITRTDCDWLEVLIKDVNEHTIKGTISGKCIR